MTQRVRLYVLLLIADSACGFYTHRMLLLSFNTPSLRPLFHICSGESSVVIIHCCQVMIKQLGLPWSRYLTFSWMMQLGCRLVSQLVLDVSASGAQLRSRLLHFCPLCMVLKTWLAIFLTAPQPCSKIHCSQCWDAQVGAALSSS